MNKTSIQWQRRARAALGLGVVAGLVTACGGDSTTDPSAAPQAPEVRASARNDAAAATAPRDATALGRKSSGSSQPAAQPANTEGRLLASNCFQCHGTMGTGGFEGIRGQEAGEVLEFLRKPAARDIMAAHAQGYTTAQLQKIVAYLQQ